MIKFIPFLALFTACPLTSKPCEPAPTPTPIVIASVTPTATPTPVATDFPGWVTFVVEHRRQTDQLPRQMYALLPNEIKRSWSYYSCWTNPPPTENAVLFAAYSGYDAWQYSDPVLSKVIDGKYAETRSCIEKAYLAAPKQKIVTHMVIADSPTPGFVQGLIKDRIQPEQDKVSDKYKQPRAAVGFGYDELAVTSMAFSLGNRDVDIIISNPEAKAFWEGSNLIKDLIVQKSVEIGLTQKAGSPFRILVLTRRPGGDNSDFQPNDEAQRKFDAEFMSKNPVTETTAIVDARLYNGAWDARALPKSCEYLAAGAWGTFGNSFGSTAGIAKILLGVDKDTRKKLLLEAIGHDVFFQGYEEFQRNSLVHGMFKSEKITYDHNDKYPGSEADLKKAYIIVNKFVNQRMQEHFADTDCFKGKSITLTPQRNTLFEAVGEVR